MPGYAPVPIVQQQVMDALGAWAERATGIREVHAEQNSPKAARPYVAIEWLEEPGPTSSRVEREVAALPLSATATLSPAPEDWAAVAVNLARPGLQRGELESLSAFTDRYAAELRSFLFGRVTVARAGEAGITLAPVSLGDLWRAVAIENAVVTLGETAPARIVERVYSGTARVWVVGAATTSGKAGEPGDGRGSMELTSLLVESLVELWCRELFDAFAVRCGTPEPQPVTKSARRSNATRENRSYIDLEISTTARFGVAPNAATAVGFSIGLQQSPPPSEDAVVVEVLVDAEP